MTDIVFDNNESIELDLIENDEVITLDIVEPEEITMDFDVSTVITSDHTELVNRDAPDQHPISAIEGLQGSLDAKQDNLISGTNIKTINGESILGPGDIETLNASVSGSNERLTLWYGQTV